jgi:hypothetical protein
MDWLVLSIAAVLGWIAMNLVANSYLMFERNAKDRLVWVQQALALMLVLAAVMGTKGLI